MRAPHFRHVLLSAVLFALFARVLPALANQTMSGQEAAAPASNSFSAALAQGPLYAGLAAFVSGFLVSLTPCVYPMVAVTVSVFGARQVSSRWQGTLLSGAFVAGIVAMFVPLGVIAGLTGSVFGSALSSTWVVLGISGLFLIMAASMFGAFDLDLPDALKNRLVTVGGGGYLGAFILGLACGPIAAPCTGPFLTGILTWIAQTQSAFLGGIAMATFALGLGVPFFLVGAFAVQLPKSGRWMVHIKSILGIILCVVALYFLAPLFPVLSRPASNSAVFLAAAAAVAVLGLVLGAVHRAFEAGELRNNLAKGLGVLLTVGACFLFIVGITKPSRTLSWEKDAQGQLGSPTLALAAKQKAASEGQPYLIDFTASWCGACKELDKLTFSDARVAQEAGRFLAAKVDATDDTDPAVEKVMKDLSVVGLPTVILFDSKGVESKRFTDFVPADQFLAALQAVQ
ncbi:MAG TPA: cytochrome c biogenesis protein CcdA [Polyangiaceae bacterium]|nr:cytochrome c biogenesis protein CcdA [Polyangiaceae bacterium]